MSVAGASDKFNERWLNFLQDEKIPEKRVPDDVVIGREWCWDHLDHYNTGHPTQTLVVQIFKDTQYQLNFDKPETIDSNLFQFNGIFNLECDGTDFLNKRKIWNEEEDEIIENAKILISRFKEKVEQIAFAKRFYLRANEDYVTLIAFILAFKSYGDIDTSMQFLKDRKDLPKFRRMQQSFLMMIDNHLHVSFKDRWAYKIKNELIEDVSFESYFYEQCKNRVQYLEDPFSNNEVDEYFEAHELMESVPRNSETTLKKIGLIWVETQVTVSVKPDPCKAKEAERYQMEYEDARSKFLQQERILELITDRNTLRKEYKEVFSRVVAANNEFSKRSEYASDLEKELKNLLEGISKLGQAYNETLNTDPELKLLRERLSNRVQLFNKYVCSMMVQDSRLVDKLTTTDPAEAVIRRIRELRLRVFKDMPIMIFSHYVGILETRCCQTAIAGKIMTTTHELKVLEARIREVENDFETAVFYSDIDNYFLYQQMNYRKARHLRFV